MKLVMVGTGAFAKKHLDGIARIKGAEVVSIVGRVPETTEAIAKKYNIPHMTTNLDEALKQPGVDAAIITSPTQVHAAQAIQVMRAGKHVQIEIPIADSLADSETNPRNTEGDRRHRNGRPYATLQSKSSVDPQADRKRRTQATAPCRSDILLPANKHERRRQTPKLDGSSALASCLPYGGSVPVSDRRDGSPRPGASRAPSIPNSASRWT